MPLRKVCRRPETDYRLQQLHAVNESAAMNQQKPSTEPPTGNTLRVYPPAAAVDTKGQQPKVAEVGSSKLGNITNAPKDIVAEVVSATNAYVPTTDNKVVNSVGANNNVGNPNVSLGEVVKGGVGGASSNMGNPNLSPDKVDVVVGGASNAVNPVDPPPNSVAVVSGSATNTTITGGSGEEMRQG